MPEVGSGSIWLIHFCNEPPFSGLGGAWLVARPLARLLLMQLGLTPQAVLLIDVWKYSLPARRPSPLRSPVAINVDLLDH